jgi:hypothetical protein
MHDHLRAPLDRSDQPLLFARELKRFLLNN